MDNEYLLSTYSTTHGSSIPLPLKQFILDGELAGFPDTPFTDPLTGKEFIVRFIKDMEYGGTADQSIRVAISDTFDTQEPIGFAKLDLQSENDDFLYYLIIFPKNDPHRMIGLDENDLCPVYLLKFKGYPIDEDDLEEDEESDFECEIHGVAEGFNQFIADLRKNN